MRTWTSITLSVLLLSVLLPGCGDTAYVCSPNSRNSTFEMTTRSKPRLALYSQSQKMCYHNYQPTYSDYVGLTRVGPAAWFVGISANERNSSRAVDSWKAFDDPVRWASEQPFSQIGISGESSSELHSILITSSTRFSVSDGESSILGKEERQ